MAHRLLSLFGLHGSDEFAGLVARRLEIALAPYEERGFEDGEHKARPLQDVRGHDVFVLQSLHGDDKESGNDGAAIPCRPRRCGAAPDRAGCQRIAFARATVRTASSDRRKSKETDLVVKYNILYKQLYKIRGRR